VEVEMKLNCRSPFLLLLLATLLAGAAAPAPDLIVHNLALNPPQVAPGGTVGVALNIANAGDAPSSPTTAEIRLSSDSTIDSSDVLLGIVQIPPLPPGAGLPQNTSVLLAGNTPPGNYFLGVILDPANQVAESNENNNTASQPLTITAGPNPPLQLRCSPASITAADFSTEQSLCFVTQDCGSTGACPVAFECRDLPSDVACQFSPNPVQISPGASSASSTLRIKIGPNAADGLPTKTWCFGVRVTDDAGQSQQQQICVRLVVLRTNTAPVLRDGCQAVNWGHLVQKPDEEIVASNPGTVTYNISAEDLDTSQNLTIQIISNCGGGSCPGGSPGPSPFTLRGSNPVKVFDGDPCQPGGANDLTHQAIIRIDTNEGTRTPPLRSPRTEALRVRVSADVPSSRKMWCFLLVQPDTPGLQEFRSHISVNRAFTCPTGCNITSPVTTPFMATASAPVELTLQPRIQATLQTSQGSETVNLQGTMRIFAWTQTDGRAMDTYLEDGRDDLPVEILSADLRGTSTLLGGPITVRVRDAGQHPFRRSMGVITEHANSQAGRLDIRPFAPSGAATMYLDFYAQIEQGGSELHTEGAVPLECTVTQLPPAPGTTCTASLVTEVRDKNETACCPPLVVTGSCSGYSFVQLGGPASQRVAALIVLWSPLAVLAVLRRRARRRGR